MWSNEELVGNPQVLVLQLSYFLKKLLRSQRFLKNYSLVSPVLGK